MANNNIVSSLDLLHTIFFIIIITSMSFSLASRVIHQQPTSTLAHQNSLIEDKTRLGSTPPTCHNKCNDCHPCTAVQVPTQPSQNRVDPGPSGTTGRKPTEPASSLPSTAAAKFANYKPLGWKCRCGSRLFNP